MDALSFDSVARMEIIQSFRIELERRGLSARTAQLYAGEIRRFIEAIGRIPSRESLKKDVEEFARTQPAGGQHAAWKSPSLRPALKHLAAYLRLRDAITIPSVPRSRAEARGAAPVPDHVAAIIGRLHEPWRSMVLLIARTGMTPCEVVALRVGDVDLRRKRILIRSMGRRRPRSIRLPGCLRARLAEACAAALAHVGSAPMTLAARYRPGAESTRLDPTTGRDLYLFPSPTKRGSSTTGVAAMAHVSTRSIDAAIREAQQDEPVDTLVTATTIRRSAIIAWIQRGVPLPVLMQRLGLSTAAALDTYVAEAAAPHSSRQSLHGAPVDPARGRAATSADCGPAAAIGAS